MSLVKSPTLTPEKHAANQVNGRQSQGPVTVEGLERMRDSKIQHGFYSDLSDEALRALGEDPAEMQRLIASLEDIWEPSDEFQSRLVRRLARALWRLERSDRVQERAAADRARVAAQEAEEMARRACLPHFQRIERLQQLRDGVIHDDFYAGLEDFELFDEIYVEERAGAAEQVLELLTRLQVPPEDVPEEGQDQESGGAGLQAEAETEDGDSDDSQASDEDSLILPDVPIAVGPDRDHVRRQLIDLLNEEIKAADAARRSRREAVLRANLPYLRDQAIPPKLKEARVVFRMEESSFRQVGRLSDLLLKLQKRTKREKTHSEDEGTTHDVAENKGAVQATHDVHENKDT